MSHKREQDITGIVDETFLIHVNGQAVIAVPGESLLSTLLASGIRQFMTNDHGVQSGAYCGMGVCHCCMLSINGEYKQRACQTLVKPGMKVLTNHNRVLEAQVEQGQSHES